MHEPTVVRVIAFPNAMLLPLVTFLLFLLAAAGPPGRDASPFYDFGKLIASGF